MTTVALTGDVATVGSIIPRLFQKHEKQPNSKVGQNIHVLFPLIATSWCLTYEEEPFSDNFLSIFLQTVCTRP